MDQIHLQEWESDITEVRRNSLKTHGTSQETIIREFSYEEMIFFLLKKRRPTGLEKTLLRSVIVSHISHGITGQSTLAVRMAADTRAPFLHALIAGFSTGAGIYHQGNLEITMRELAQLTAMAEDDAERLVLEKLERGERIMGFGHRFHKERDPRAETLLEIAEELGHRGQHYLRAKAIAGIIKQKKGVPANIEIACGSLLLDLGIEPEIAHLIIIVGRGPMFAAAYIERLRERRAPFQRIKVFDEVST